MNILVLGATGFIGSHVTTVLLQEGHNVTCGIRDIKYGKNLFPQCKMIKCDFQRDTSTRIWKPRLENIDILINCVGIFYHPNKKVIWNIHYYSPKAIFDAAFDCNIKKIIHVSALNSELYSVEYARSKKAAEDHLLNSGVPSIILKPSLVYGNGSSGGMKLFRTLASFPWFLPIPGKGNQKFQPLHIDDLTEAILKSVKSPIGINKILYAVSNKPITLLNIIKTWRKWLGFSKPYVLHIPLFLMNLSNYFYDLIPYSTVNSDALKMLNQNNIARREDVHNFQHEIGFVPRDFKSGVLSMPCETEDRWYSVFSVYRPILKFSLAFIWIVSAITSSFLYPKTESYQLLSSAGVPTFIQAILLYGASGINFVIGITLLCNYKIKLNYTIQILIICIYTLIISIKLPYLWLEPFGPVAKNIPLLALILFLYNMERNK